MFSTLMINKCFLSTKLAYGIKMISEGTCDSEVMMLKIQLYRHRNKLHFKMYYNKNNNFLKYEVLIFDNIAVFSVFC